MVVLKTHFVPNIARVLKTILFFNPQAKILRKKHKRT